MNLHYPFYKINCYICLFKIKSTMYRNLIHIGSNVFSRLNIDKAKRMLLYSFPDIVFTNHVIIFSSSEEEKVFPFRNILGLFYTDMPVEEVIRKIKSIEFAIDKRPKDRDRGKVIIDIDLLQYGDEVLRNSDLEKDYVQELVTEFNDNGEQAKDEQQSV